MSEQIKRLSETASFLALESFTDTDFESSNEAFNVFHSVLDAFGRILNNFKTYLTKGFKGFKRSELNAYENAHRLLIGRALKGPIHNFSTIQVPIPDGMKTSYKESSTMLLSLMDELNFKSMVDQVLIYLKEYDRKSVDEYHTLKQKTIDITKKISNVSEQRIEKSFKAAFSGTHTPGRVPIDKVFSDLKEVSQVYEDVKRFEKNYMLANSYLGKIQEIEKTVNKLIDQFENVKIDQNYLKAFHMFLLTCARQIDYFGAVLDTAQRVEHNFVYVVHEVGKAYKQQKNK